MLRSVSPSTRGAGPAPARCAKSVSNVPTVPASSAPFAGGELPLDAVDVDAVRDDQPGIAVERVDEPLQQERDLTGVRRPDDEREPHRPW